jgi:hypothetical protein
VEQGAAVKSWEIIADNLRKAGWSLGWVSALDREGRTIWIVDAHRGDGKRFVVHADEKLTAFLELERAVCIHLLLSESIQTRRTQRVTSFADQIAMTALSVSLRMRMKS